MTILIGFMGAGKTTVARLLDTNFIDLDAYIEAQAGRSIPEIFAQEGENAFRQFETETLSNLTTQNIAVIATGGGIVESQSARELLSNVTDVIYLKATFDELAHRITSDKKNVRPLAKDGLESLRARFLNREPYYDALSNLTVDTTDKTPQEIAQEIIRWHSQQKKETS
ncbi:MAG: shikimate kinase [Streptococcaceae bacterium]|jgi:shikimate kinase|nr:shikimate kinase [Streptococcaceae bacterium]